MLPPSLRLIHLSFSEIIAHATIPRNFATDFLRSHVVVEFKWRLIIGSKKTRYKKVWCVVLILRFRRRDILLDLEWQFSQKGHTFHITKQIKLTTNVGISFLLFERHSAKREGNPQWGNLVGHTPNLE